MTTVWIVEKDHEPLVMHGRLVAFASDPRGSRKVKQFLNELQEEQPGPYYDAILYARPA